MTRNLEFGLLALAAFVIVAVSTAFYASFPLNHDSSWYLVATRMFLDGGTLYEDVVEINPPLAFYLTAPALLLADLSGLRPTTAYFLYVSALGAISAVWIYALCRRTALELAPRLLIGGFALAGCYLIAMQDFGQREHLMLICAIPYLTYLIFRDDLHTIGWIEQAALGLFAFLGLGLKPYFLLVPAGILTARFFSNRRTAEFFSVANVSLGIGLLFYLAFIATAHPLYISEIVPTASLIYSAYGRPPSEVLLRAEVIALFSVLTLAALCWKQLDRPAVAMLGGVLGATTAYVLQFKGWNYQLVPALYYVFVAAAWITYIARKKIREHVLFGILALSAITLSLGLQLMRGPYPGSTTEEFAAFVDRQDVPILVLSSNVWASFPFINDVNARWTSRYPAQWLLPGAITLVDQADCSRDRRLCDQIRMVISETRSRMVEDLVRGRPALVYIDDRTRKSHFGDTRFDYLEFLMRDPAFATLWRDYQLIGRTRDYEVWARTGAEGIAYPNAPERHEELLISAGNKQDNTPLPGDKH